MKWIALLSWLGVAVGNAWMPPHAGLGRWALWLVATLAFTHIGLCVALVAEWAPKQVASSMVPDRERLLGLSPERRAPVERLARSFTYGLLIEVYGCWCAALIAKHLFMPGSSLLLMPIHLLLVALVTPWTSRFWVARVEAAYANQVAAIG